VLGRARLSGPAGPLIGVAVGLLVAGAITLFQDSTYRADASIVLVREGRPPGSDPQLARAADTAAELFDSRAVAESAIRNLGLETSAEELLDRVDVEAQEGSSLVRVEVDAPSTEEARRIAQDVSEVATVLFNDRFAPQTLASVWEPAGASDERVSPKPARNLTLGALLGALAGLALVLAALRRPQSPAPAPPAGQASAPPPRAEPVAEPTTEPESASFVLPRLGEWRIADVERLLAEQGPAFPEQREELEIYLDSFRTVAGPDGRLPGGVDLVIEDVFADLIARSRG
jgi:capsular polysaccharide biosynthesis protein